MVFGLDFNVRYQPHTGLLPPKEYHPNPTIQTLWSNLPSLTSFPGLICISSLGTSNTISDIKSPHKTYSNPICIKGLPNTEQRQAGHSALSQMPCLPYRRTNKFDAIAKLNILDIIKLTIRCLCSLNVAFLNGSTEL